MYKLFHGGFSTGHGFLREPNDIASYSALACIAIQSNQNDQHGGQSIPNFDYGMAHGRAQDLPQAVSRKIWPRRWSCLAAWTTRTLMQQKRSEQVATGTGPAPCSGGRQRLLRDGRLLAVGLRASAEDAVEKAAGASPRKLRGKETDRATYQAMEALVHNLNTMHSRAGAQIPFSLHQLRHRHLPRGPHGHPKCPAWRPRQGSGNGETPIFPIHIFKVKEGVNYNPGDPNYDLFKLACRVSAKRLFPNFSFLDAPFNLQYYKPGHPETEMRLHGLPHPRDRPMYYDPTREIVNGRGNLSFTSINLPRIAINGHGRRGSLL